MRVTTASSSWPRTASGSSPSAGTSLRCAIRERAPRHKPSERKDGAMVSVNYLHVLVAAVVVFVLGWLWYSPLLFFKPWMRARGLDPAAAMAGAKMPAGKLVIELVRCLVLAYVIARFVALLGVSSWLGAVHFGLFL